MTCLIVCLPVKTGTFHKMNKVCLKNYNKSDRITKIVFKITSGITMRKTPNLPETSFVEGFKNKMFQWYNYNS